MKATTRHNWSRKPPDVNILSFILRDGNWKLFKYRRERECCELTDGERPRGGRQPGLTSSPLILPISGLPLRRVCIMSLAWLLSGRTWTVLVLIWTWSFKIDQVSNATIFRTMISAAVRRDVLFICPVYRNSSSSPITVKTVRFRPEGTDCWENRGSLSHGP